MKRALKFLGVLAATVLLFVVVALLAFYHLIQIGDLRRFLIKTIEEKTQLKVELGEADLQIGWISGVAFRDVALSTPGSPEPAITAAKITARVALMPLLSREVIIYQIGLHQPAVRLDKDPEGKIPLLDRLLNVPFLRQTGDDIRLDLRAVHVTEGNLSFWDQARDLGSPTTQLRNISLELERIRGQALRSWVESLVRPERQRPQGPALRFSLKSDVERHGKSTTLLAGGKLMFPEESLTWRSAWWDATVQLSEAPAAMLQEAAGGVPFTSIDGVLSPRLRIEGSPAQRLRIKGEAAFAQVTFEAPELFIAPVTPGDGKIDFDFDWDARHLRIAHLALLSKEISLHGRGEVRMGTETQFRFEVSTPALPVAVLRKYLPLKFLDGTPWKTYATSLHDGEIQIKTAGVSATLTELRHMASAGIDERVWCELELRNVSTNGTAEGYSPMRAVHGWLSLAKGVVHVKDLKGNYGQWRLADVDGHYRAASPGKGSFHLHVRGETDLSQLQEPLKSRLPAASGSKIAPLMSEMGGRSKIDLVLRREGEGPVVYEGKALVENAQLRFRDLALSELRGEIALAPKEIRTQKVTGLLSGSPVHIQLAVRDYDTQKGSFDLAVESPAVKAGVVSQLLLDSGSLQDPGFVRGSIHYRGPLSTPGERKLSGSLELTNVQLATEPLLQPLRELNGKVTFDENGVDFHELKGLLAGHPASVTARWRFGKKPQLTFDFAAPHLDISRLLALIDPRSSDFYGSLHAEGKVALGSGTFKTFDFSDLQTDVVLDRRVWRFNNFAARSAGGMVEGTLVISDKPETVAVSLEPRVRGVPVDGFLRWLETQTTEMTGRVNVLGYLEYAGSNAAERKKNANGALSLRIENGTIHRFRILVQILNLLDLSRWFTLQVPDLSKQGIRFRSITADFKVANGILSTQNLVVDSDDLRMTGAGKIDVGRDEIDFVVAVRPFAAIDSAIHQIPLIGRGIAAIKNSFLVASFSIKGAVDDPTITPAPLSTLSEVFFGVLGVPKKLLPLGADDPKDEPLMEPTKEPHKQPVLRARP
jgi:hypothetical protein